MLSGDFAGLGMKNALLVLPLDRPLRRWNEVYTSEDESLAIDGKTMCNALDEQSRPTHVMRVIDHQSKTCYSPKKWAPCR